MHCVNHPEVAADRCCHQCQRDLCTTCTFEKEGQYYCPDCMVTANSVAGKSSPKQSTIAWWFGLVSLGCALVHLSPSSSNSAFGEQLRSMAFGVGGISALVAIFKGQLAFVPALVERKRVAGFWLGAISLLLLLGTLFWQVRQEAKRPDPHQERTEPRR